MPTTSHDPAMGGIGTEGHRRALAMRAMALLDLTDLGDNSSEIAVQALCTRALSGPVPVAAICIWPQFVGVARQILHDRRVRIATVVNFPAGGTHTARVAAETMEAIRDGADEIDLVMPYTAFLEGDAAVAREMIAEVRACCGDRILKVILETGAFPEARRIAAAGSLAIGAGADFLKTSTGKTAISATPEAARTLLEVIRDSARPVGFKASGGIRTLADAACYLALADEIMGAGWATAERFRFGASGLYDSLTATLDGASDAGDAGVRAPSRY